MCVNHPESIGRMRRVPERGVCANYRAKPATPEGDVRQIPLGGGYYAYVDAADYEWLNQWTWQLRGGYAVRLEKRKAIYMHRQIMQTPEGMIVDHRNRNKLDNTRANLRNATPAENARNRPKPRGTSSRFLGVSYETKYRKYQAQICYQGRYCYIGFFADEIEAARARDYRAVELFGESAQVNFPEEWPPERRAKVYAQHNAAAKGGRKVRRKQAKTGGRARPRVPGHKGRAKSARTGSTHGGRRESR